MSWPAPKGLGLERTTYGHHVIVVGACTPARLESTSAAILELFFSDAVHHVPPHPGGAS